MNNNINPENNTMISFDKDETIVIKNLINWMSVFIVFYLLIGLIYSFLSVDFFISGINGLGIKPYEYYSFILLVIGIVAIILAKELYGVKKQLVLTIENNSNNLEYLGKSFKKIKNYFFVGAIFLVSFIILLLFILYYIITFVN